MKGERVGVRGGKKWEGAREVVYYISPCSTVFGCWTDIHYGFSGVCLIFDVCSSFINNFLTLITDY